MKTCETDDGEWRLAMVCSQILWRGTSITEGAAYFIERAHAEQWGKEYPPVEHKEPGDD